MENRAVFTAVLCAGEEQCLSDGHRTHRVLCADNFDVLWVDSSACVQDVLAPYSLWDWTPSFALPWNRIFHLSCGCMILTPCVIAADVTFCRAPNPSNPTQETYKYIYSLCYKWYMKYLVSRHLVVGFVLPWALFSIPLRPGCHGEVCSCTVFLWQPPPFCSFCGSARKSAWLNLNRSAGGLNVLKNTASVPLGH